MENKFRDDVVDRLMQLEKQSDAKAYFEALKWTYGSQAGGKKDMPAKMLKSDGVTLTASKEETAARLVEHARVLFNPVDTADMVKIQHDLPEQREINEELNKRFVLARIIGRRRTWGQKKRGALTKHQWKRYTFYTCLMWQ